MTRYVLRSAAATVVAALALAGCGDSNVGVAARVGDTEITAAAVAERVEESVRAGIINADGRAALQSGWVAQLVKRNLHREAARRLGVLPDDAELQRRIDEYIRVQGGLQALERGLARNSVAPRYVRAVVESIVLYEAVADELVKDVQKTEQELRAAYQARLAEFDVAEIAHINVKEKKVADDLVKRLRAGADFAQLAKTFSRDTDTKDRGGNLGMIGNGQGQIDPKISGPIFAAKPGGIVGPLPLQDGFEIIRVVRRDTTTFEQARERLRRDLLAKERQERTAEYLRTVAREVGVSVNPRFGRWDGNDVVEARDSLSTTQPTPGANQPADPVAPGGAPSGSS